MLAILSPRHGAILNHNHGIETADSLKIQVSGLCDESGFLTVNGQPAIRNGKLFTADVTLTSHENTITAEIASNSGNLSYQVKVIWDRKSFKRFNLFVDDHSFFWTDLAREKPAKAFEHFYLAFWKEMHQKYNLKVTLNCFYRNDHDKCEITEVPDCYKSEFIDNSDWLKLAFHAYSEFPDRPYQNVGGDKLAADYDLVKSEIVRFAGEQTYQAPNVVHWAMARRSAILELLKRGVKAVDGQFCNASTGLSDDNSDGTYCDIGYFIDKSEAEYLQTNRFWHDFSTGMTYMRQTGTINLMPYDQIPSIMDKAINNGKGLEAINMITHEQYFFPRYFNYLPDHQKRVDLVLRILTENGYRSVFFNHGFLGNEN